MGQLHFGRNLAATIDDRPLAHLERAMLTLLRRGRGLAFSFSQNDGDGDVRETVWITPSSELRFRFLGGRPPALNERWVDAIIVSADEPAGLRLVAEPPLRQPLPVYAGGYGRSGYPPRPI